MTENDDMVDALVGHRVDVLRAAQATQDRIILLLLFLGARMAALVSDADLAGSKYARPAPKAREGLIVRLGALAGATYATVRGLLKRDMASLAEVEGKFASTLVGAKEPGRGDLNGYLAGVLVHGAPLADWWAKQQRDLQHRMATEIRLGVAAREGNDKLAARLRGTSTGATVRLPDADGVRRSVMGYSGGVLAWAGQNAGALVQGAFWATAHAVDAGVWLDAPKVRGRQWVAVLDTRTTAGCRALSGACWDFQGKLLPDSPVRLKFPGPPPRHWNCRSTLAPLFAGTPAARFTYDDWLRRQPEAVQREALGVLKWKLWRDGTISLAGLVDQSGNPLTLDALRRKVGL